MARTVGQTIDLARDAQRVVNVHVAAYVCGQVGALHTCIGLTVAAKQMAAAVDLLPLSSLRRDAYRALRLRAAIENGSVA